MQFGKIENNSIVYLKLPLKTPNGDLFTNDPIVLLHYGYKEIISADQPVIAYTEKLEHSFYEAETQIFELWEIIQCTEEELKEKYNALVRQYIAEQYDNADENKVIRQYLAYPYDEQCIEEFNKYNLYVEACKTRAYTEVYQQN